MLYVVRHGKTDWNLKNKIQGRVDIPLNNSGLQEAKITKELLNQTYFYEIISSPLIRAKKTAEIISNYEIPVIVDSRIIERDFGEFEDQYLLYCCGVPAALSACCCQLQVPPPSASSPAASVYSKWFTTLVPPLSLPSYSFSKDTCTGEPSSPSAITVTVWLA